MNQTEQAPEEQNDEMVGFPTETEASAQEAPSPILFKFTNKEESPYLDSLLAMFYEGAFTNTIGIMEAHCLKTEQEEMILVGVALDADGKAECYPLAKLLRAEDVRDYLSPDGKGGFYDPLNPVEVANAKEDMKSFKDAVIE